jgi:hypothetical protein
MVLSELCVNGFDQTHGYLPDGTLLEVDAARRRLLKDTSDFTEEIVYNYHWNTCKPCTRDQVEEHALSPSTAIPSCAPGQNLPPGVDPVVCDQWDMDITITWECEEVVIAQEVGRKLQKKVIEIEEVDDKVIDVIDDTSITCHPISGYVVVGGCTGVTAMCPTEYPQGPLPVDFRGHLILQVPAEIQSYRWGIELFDNGENTVIPFVNDNGGFTICTGDYASANCQCAVYPPMVWDPDLLEWVYYCDRVSNPDCECNEDIVLAECGFFTGLVNEGRIDRRRLSSKGRASSADLIAGRRLNSEEGCRIPSCASGDGYPPNGNSGGHPRCSGCGQGPNGGHTHKCQNCCPPMGGNGCGAGAQG